MLETYLASADPEQQTFAQRLIQKGCCFVVVQGEHGLLFGPSRFVGYRENSRKMHEVNERKHSAITTRAINHVLGGNPKRDAELEREYQRFCGQAGIKVYERRRRTYWRGLLP